MEDVLETQRVISEGRHRRTSSRQLVAQRVAEVLQASADAAGSSAVPAASATGSKGTGSSLAVSSSIPPVLAGAHVPTAPLEPHPLTDEALLRRVWSLYVLLPLPLLGSNALPVDSVTLADKVRHWGAASCPALGHVPAELVHSATCSVLNELVASSLVKVAPLKGAVAVGTLLVTWVAEEELAASSSSANAANKKRRRRLSLSVPAAAEGYSSLSSPSTLSARPPSDVSAVAVSDGTGSAALSSSKKKARLGTGCSGGGDGVDDGEVVELPELSLEALLAKPSSRERDMLYYGTLIANLINTPTVMEQRMHKRFRSQGGSNLSQFCEHLVMADCRKALGHGDCAKIHFRRVIRPHTDVRLGDCNYLDACRHPNRCKMVHYELDENSKPFRDRSNGSSQQGQSQSQSQSSQRQRGLRGSSSSSREPSRDMNTGMDTNVNTNPNTSGNNEQDDDGDALMEESLSAIVRSDLVPQVVEDYSKYPPQFLNIDVRTFKFELLGKFGIVMADPPWDIHMELPYGTLSDQEMLELNISVLQDDGLIFLWVTGRAMELARQCMIKWGYRPSGELVWVKTNQVNRLIRTGRTGHWLNHSKEHCIIGIKGNPMINRHLDCDVIVSQVRETSRKPDEIYTLLERLAPGVKKIEIFGRPHNTRRGWVTLGNQLPGNHVADPLLFEALSREYRDMDLHAIPRSEWGKN